MGRGCENGQLIVFVAPAKFFWPGFNRRDAKDAERGFLVISAFIAPLRFSMSWLLVAAPRRWAFGWPSQFLGRG